MGLYLCIFDEDEDEVDGVDVGAYADFGAFRDHVTAALEGGVAGSRYPMLIGHSDCDGEWTVDDCAKLRDELGEIASALQRLPPLPFASDWQRDVAKSVGLRPRNALESFVDVDGELLVDRLVGLVETALKRNRPILFQ